LTTRKSSSSWSWWCQTERPLELDQLHLLAVQLADDLRCHWSPNCASFSLRFTFSMTVSLLLLRPTRTLYHGAPRRSIYHQGILAAEADRHRQVERERHGRLALGHEEVAGELTPAQALVERHQARLADQQAEIDISLLVEEVKRSADRRAGEPPPS